MHQLTLFLIGLTASTQLLAADYRVVSIDVPNSIATRARGINARGDIVGGFTDAGGTDHGFLLRKGIVTVIDVPNAAVTQSVRAISDQGDMVGNFLDTNFTQHGFLLRKGQFVQI